MNYITEIKAFYDLLETNPLPTPAIVLWHALMHLANKTGWQQEFAVAVSVLEVKTGMGGKAIERARNQLSQAGLIVWRKRRGNQSAAYRVCSLCDRQTQHFDPQSVLQPVAQPAAQSVAQPVDITKHRQNETKQEREKNPPPVVKPTLEELQEYCLERGNGIDPQLFYDFQESRGWMLGNGRRMSDWKAAVRTWEHRDRQRQHSQAVRQNPSARIGEHSSIDLDKLREHLHRGDF